MFKRVERKLKKKQKEEELGIDEDMKEVLGIHDTDSDESDSESESSSSSSSDENSDGDKDGVQRTSHSLEKKRKRGAFESEDDEVEDEDEEAGSTDPEDGNEDEGDEDEDEGDEDEDDDAVDMSVEEALHNPLYIVSIQPDIRACILCPGKLLKTPEVVEVHEASQAHRRRSKRFKELADGADPDDSARDILKNGLSAFSSQTKSSDQSSQKLSKRASKRVAKFEQMKKRRQKQKAGKAKTLAKKAEKSAAPLPASATLDDLESEKPLRTKKQNTNPPSSNRDRPKIKTPSKALNGTHPKKSKISAQLPATKIKLVKERPKKRRKSSGTST